MPAMLPRPGGGPVFVDPHGRRLRRMRAGARALAAAAGIYLLLLALGLAGTATSPLSLVPGLGGDGGSHGKSSDVVTAVGGGGLTSTTGGGGHLSSRFAFLDSGAPGPGQTQTP